MINDIPTDSTVGKPSFKIIVADDDVISLYYLIALLQCHNHKPLHAKNGKDVLDILENEAVDLVIIDIKMPEMDGIELYKTIRNSSKWYKNVPILAVTAYAMKEDRERFLSIGIDEYLSKPVLPEDVLDAVDRLCCQEV